MYKSTITILALLLISVCSGQSISIGNEDMPVPSKDFELRKYDRNIKFSIPENKTWNYSMLGEGELIGPGYAKETDPYFVNANLPLCKKSSNQFVKGWWYDYSSKIAFPGDGIYEAGYQIPAQSFPLTKFTGKATDLLNIPEQKYILDAPKKIIEFPVTETSSWTSESRRVTNFNLTVEAFGLINVPAQQVWTVYREDKIISQGKARLYNPKGMSRFYDVLVDQISEYAIDSFYLAGSPAPAALLNAFGATQGQKVTIDNRINFYRKGSFSYLFSIYYGANGFDGESISLSGDSDVELPE